MRAPSTVARAFRALEIMAGLSGASRLIRSRKPLRLTLIQKDYVSVLSAVRRTDAPLILADRDLPQRRVQDDFVSTTVQHRLGTHSTIKLVRNKTLWRPGRDSWKFRNDLLRLERWTLHARID